MSRFTLNRRDFLKASAIAATGILVQACAKTPTTAPTATAKAAQPTATTAPAAAKEAPALADMVKAGKIPAVAERIPQDPMVIKPFKEVGKYGEDVHRVLKGASDLTGYRVIVRDNLVCWSYVTGQFTIENNLASKWEVTPDGRVHVLPAQGWQVERRQAAHHRRLYVLLH